MGKWKGTYDFLQGNDRALQRSMTSLLRCNSQSPQQQESYESQSTSCSRDRLRFATCCWIGSVAVDKIIFAYHRAGFTLDFMKYNAKIGEVLTNESFALYLRKWNNGTDHHDWYLWDYSLLRGIHCFADENLMKFNERRAQAACKFARKSAARFFKAKVVSRSKYIYGTSYIFFTKHG